MKDFNEFLQGLVLQFEECELSNINETTNLWDLETFDSLTRFSIIAFISDEYNLEFKVDIFEVQNTPLKLYKMVKDAL